jgi:uncharacterized protein YyaL (SSP411 family)
MQEQKHTNELINESSPYLLQHAHNPVDWHAWNEDNLKTAKKLGKPILISIGYSSCHWCHVMEHESFEDEQVAAYMNEHFYCIKVDREERPDVDQLYMTAANIITGGGGWPLNCFALPDGRPFHAGTYYPKQGWLKLLETVHYQYTTNTQKIEGYAAKLTQGIRLQETAISDAAANELHTKNVQLAVEQWKHQWDMKRGGINKAPKFPMPSNYNFLLSYVYQFNDVYTQDFIATSLKEMAYGGIYDQIGGGFSRYSVDSIWKVPHFEKMLYDNAQLLTIYAKAYQQSGDKLYKKVIDQTIGWLKREMLDESGMFYAALDADSEGEEGKFYVWNEQEVKSILGDDFTLAQFHYQLGEKGLWEHGNNILMARPIEETAQYFKLEQDLVKDRLLEIDQKLLKERNKRIRPGLDDKCLTSWNGLLLSGLADAFKATQNQSYRNLAEECCRAILEKMWTDDELMHTYKNEKSTISGMLEDYAFLAQGCLDVYQITGEELFYNTAVELTQKALELFYHTEKGLFYFNRSNELVVQMAELHDNVIPATNSAMARLLNYIGLLEGNSYYLSIASELCSKVQEGMQEYTGSYANWALATLEQTAPFYEVAVVGTDAQQMAGQLQQLFLPNTLIVYTEKQSTLPLFKDRWNENETRIFVCRKGACQMPVNTPQEALNQLQ